MTVCIYLHLYLDTTIEGHLENLRTLVSFQGVQPWIKCQELRPETKVLNTESLVVPSNEHCEVFYANGVKGLVAKSMAGWDLPRAPATILQLGVLAFTVEE